MLFGSRRRKPSRRQEWREFARRLELTDASQQDARLRDWFDLGDSPLSPLLSLRRKGQPTLFFFDQERERSGPAGTVTSLVTGALLRAPEPLAVASLRALPRGNPVLESIVAGRTGSRRLDLGELPDFDAQVSVFARDEEAARAWLTKPVQRVIQRMLVGRGVTPTLVVGGWHMLTLCEGGDPAGFEALESVATDLLTLFVMVEGTVAAAAPRAGAATPQPDDGTGTG
ncbi:MAG TPA: hypothetical protein VKA00_04545 [Trueperaceae bacterium]|nr:hypothetical protein [Trueperaceae bacterium]